MVPKIRRGSRTHGLLAYLYGPGKRDEHIDPHLVASWDGFAPDPGRDGEATLAHLAAALDLRVKQAGAKAPTQHVWHCSVRTAPGDRQLTDDDWGTVARRLVHAVGIAPDGDPDGCRWVAVRHADDHIHILATLMRGDLRRPRINRDFPKAQAECRTMEKEMGLRQLKPGDGTAAKMPTSAERFKAERLGREQTPRETLREAVRQALAGAATEEEFFTRLRDAGVRVKLRHAPSGDVLGYTVALPGDRNRDRAPVWFAGSTLAPDLSLPKIHRRLATPVADPTEEAGASASGRWSAAAERRRHAAAVAEHAASRLTTDGDEAADQLAGVGELLDALAQTSPATIRQELRAAAQAFERATRSHIRAERADNRALRAAAREIIHAGAALGRGEDGGATAMLLSTLVMLAMAAEHWHSERHHAQQAAACQQTADHLYAAYRQAAAAPMQALRDQGRALPPAQLRRYEAAIATALPDPAPAAADERNANRDALAATLAQVEQAGHDPEALLRQAIAMRELETAESVNDVLVWRLRRLADLPAYPQPDTRPAPARTWTTAAARANVPSAPAAPTADPHTRPARR
jgi:hypothetical protein